MQGPVAVEERPTISAAAGADARRGAPQGSRRPPGAHRVLIVYGSRFGNTQRVAEALASGLRRVQGIEVECVSIERVPFERLGDYELVAVGGPTEVMSASASMKEFLA